jgi:hypothetical protein
VPCLTPRAMASEREHRPGRHHRVPREVSSHPSGPEDDPPGFTLEQSPKGLGRVGGGDRLDNGAHAICERGELRRGEPQVKRGIRCSVRGGIQADAGV